jgi:SAM-dependent methyltransferase
MRHLLLGILLITALGTVPLSAGQAPAAPSAADVKVYEDFRYWLSKQPPGSPGAPLERYRQELKAQGVEPAEVERRATVINERGSRLEVERWNRILTAERPTFNTNPNDFLVRMTKGRTAGTALDVGMGQGRNALYLAQQGWKVTGFDPAEKAVAAAQAQAKALGVTLDTRVEGDETFDFGQNRWDLIVLSYVSLRDLVPKVVASLTPGGIVVIEGFHRDATKNSSIGAGVVFDTNELLRLFDALRVLHYEDADAIGDFGKSNTRVVRLAAQKR